MYHRKEEGEAECGFAHVVLLHRKPSDKIVEKFVAMILPRNR